MLVLTRRPQEKIIVGDEIEVTVVGVQGNRVRIGVNAPKEVAVLRRELLSMPDREWQEGTETAHSR